MPTPFAIGCLVERRACGYMWAKSGDDPFLVSVEKPGEMPTEADCWQPLKKETALFSLFAKLEPTTESIIAFANKYGRLTLRSGWREFELPTGTVQRGYGDQRQQWLAHVTAMRYWLSMWELVKEKKAKAIKDLVESLPTSPDYDDMFQRSERNILFQQRRISAPVLNCDNESRVAVAKQVLIDATSSMLQQVATKEDAFQLAVAFDSELDGGVFHLVGGGLGSAVWAQFAQAVCGNKEYRRCETCGERFEQSPDAYRSNRLYCSNYCRLKAHRKKVRDAQRMQRMGKTQRQIAAALGTDVSTIKNWLKQKGK